MSMRRRRRMVSSGATATATTPSATAVSTVLARHDDVEAHVGHGRAPGGRDDPAVQDQPDRPHPPRCASSPISRPSAISSPRTRRQDMPKAKRVARSLARSSALMLVAL